MSRVPATHRTGKFIAVIIVALGLATPARSAEVAKPDRTRLDRVQQTLSADVPRVLCLDEDFATGAQPKGEAYAKAAASGFRSVVNLRTASEGLDLARERALVEKTGMRFFNIPVVSSAPRPEQADEFLKLARDKAQHPMLITCASANRVGAFMMILRVAEQGWSEEKALEEATRIGLNSATLKQFAQNYLAARKSPQR